MIKFIAVKLIQNMENRLLFLAASAIYASSMCLCD